MKGTTLPSTFTATHHWEFVPTDWRRKSFADREGKVLTGVMVKAYACPGMPLVASDHISLEDCEESEGDEEGEEKQEKQQLDMGEKDQYFMGWRVSYRKFNPEVRTFKPVSFLQVLGSC